MEEQDQPRAQHEVNKKTYKQDILTAVNVKIECLRVLNVKMTFPAVSRGHAPVAHLRAGAGQPVPGRAQAARRRQEGARLLNRREVGTGLGDIGARRII